MIDVRAVLTAEAEAALVEAHAAVVGELLCVPVIGLERVGNGRNSRVYRVRSALGDLAAKFYFHRTADGRDRAAIEYGAFDFLWRQAMRTIPRPVAVDAARQVAIYGFVDGQAIEVIDATREDVTALAVFLRHLKRLAGHRDALMFSPAAEACFTVADIVGNIRRRYDAMSGIASSGPTYDALRSFLRAEFQPALERFEALARDGAGSAYRVVLPAVHRTLSPSDLGFHNAMRQPDGGLVFLDFEYFGWDDPAKTLCDALWHPRMQFGAELKAHLAREVAGVFDADAGWRARVDIAYPLFGLKWCMILLNEFKSEQLQRRQFIDREPEEAAVIQTRQLEGARSLLARVCASANFPFW